MDVRLPGQAGRRQPGYLISVFGAEDLVDTFRDKLQTAYPGTQIVSDDPIA